jgi:hypothetical protein
MDTVTIRVGDLLNIIPMVKFGLIKNPNDPAVTYPPFKDFYRVEVTLQMEDWDTVDHERTAYKVRSLTGWPYWIVVTRRISEDDIDLFTICEVMYVKA